MSHEALLGGKAGREFWQNNPRASLIQTTADRKICVVGI